MENTIQDVNRYCMNKCNNYNNYNNYCYLNNTKEYKQTQMNKAIDHMLCFDINNKDVPKNMSTDYCNEMNMNQKNFMQMEEREVKIYEPENMEPLEHLYEDVHKIMLIIVDENIEEMIKQNMGMMPKAISKKQYTQDLDNMFKKCMSNEKIAEKYIYDGRINSGKYGQINRISCPNCQGSLKSLLEIIFLTQLVRRGCIFCY